MDTYDTGIIGGGIVGLATAKALLDKSPRSLVVFEAEDEVARHQTGHNSGVIHAGLYYRPGSLKATLCREGREAMYRFCQERGIRHERCGKIIVAVTEDEVPALRELEARAKENRTDGVTRLTRDDIRTYEPYAAGVEGLHVPVTGIVDFRDVALAMADCIREKNGEVRTGCGVDWIEREDEGFRLETAGGEVWCRRIVCCAGLHADRIARMCGVDPKCRIIPFRGEYYTIVPSRASLVRNLIYPVPDPRFPFLGVHLTRMVDGTVEAGPNAVLAFSRHGYRKTSINPVDALEALAYGGFRRLSRRFWKTGMGEMWRSLSKGAFTRTLQRLLPELNADDLRPGGAGVRAQAVDPDGGLVDDFRIIVEDGMVHVINAPSPAATASLTIGEHIASLVV